MQVVSRIGMLFVVTYVKVVCCGLFYVGLSAMASNYIFPSKNGDLKKQKKGIELQDLSVPQGFSEFTEEDCLLSKHLEKVEGKG
jgi:hypothetical protein